MIKAVVLEIFSRHLYNPNSLWKGFSRPDYEMVYIGDIIDIEVPSKLLMVPEPRIYEGFLLLRGWIDSNFYFKYNKGIFYSTQAFVCANLIIHRVIMTTIGKKK